VPARENQCPQRVSGNSKEYNGGTLGTKMTEKGPLALKRSAVVGERENRLEKMAG